MMKPGPLRASASQEHFWHLWAARPGSNAYNLGYVFELCGALDVDHLCGAIERVVTQCYPDAGCAFTQSANGDIYKTPMASWQLTVNRQSCQSTALAQQHGHDMIGRPFDLRQGGLCCFSLLEIAHQTWRLVMCFAHIVFDGMSYVAFLKDVARLYQHSTASLQPPEVPRPHVDMSTETLSYWTEQLRCASVTHPLPFGRPRGPVASQLDAVTYCIPAVEVRPLKSAVDALGATLFQAMAAAAAGTLARYCLDDQSPYNGIVGYSVRSGSAPAHGCHVDILPMHVQVHGDTTFPQLVRQVCHLRAEARAHKCNSGRTVLRQAAAAGVDVGRAPFNVAVHLSPGLVRCRSLELKGVRCRPLPVPPVDAAHELAFVFDEVDDGLQVRIEYDRMLFEPAVMQGVARTYRQLLMCYACAKPVVDLDLQCPWEPMAVGRSADLSCFVPVPAQLARVCSQRGDAVAVRTPQETLTYAELEELAQALAEHLVALLPARAEPVVGLCCGRSVHLVVGLYAIWKAGAAYLPLDPAYPQPRLQYMLTDSQACAVLTDEEVAGQALAHMTGLPALDITQGRRSPRAPFVSRSGDAAYLIYTSGSTGTPKGVTVTHRNLANFIGAMAVCPGCSATDVVLGLTSISFDIAGLELWLPLTCGAALALADRDVASDPLALAAFIEAHEVTLLQATPSMYRLLQATGWKPQSPRRLLVGGEVLATDLAAHLLTLGAQVFNMYGPTETTVWSTTWRVTADFAISLGDPITNTQLYVVDRHGRPCPPGLAGQLVIGGAGVARGYHGNPVHPSFAPLPEVTGPVYRTGDCVRHLGRGHMVLVGRMDDQVKLHGHRIELGDIEAALRSQTDVRDAAVVLVQSPVAHLVAFVVAPAAAAAQALHGVRQLLPAHMTPRQIIPLEALPRTPAGKLDRKNLVNLVPAERTDAPVPVASGILAVILELAAWVRSANLRSTDRFGDVGFDSIDYARLAAALKRRLQTPVSPTDFFFPHHARSPSGAPLPECGAAAPGDERTPPGRSWRRRCGHCGHER